MSAAEAARLVAEGLAYLLGNDFPNATRVAQAALALAPQDADALHFAGVVAWRIGRPDDAARLLERAIESAPDHAEARKNLGIVLFELGRLDEAQVRFRQATMLQPGMAAAHHHLAMVLREKGDIDSAITVLRRVLSLEPENTTAGADLAAALKDRGRLTEAITAFRRIVAASPDDTLAWINFGRALLDFGDSAGARDAFARALALDPAAHMARFGACLAELPICYESEAQVSESRRRYSAALTALCAHYESAAPQDRAAAAAIAAEMLPFYLAYQGEDDRALQRMFGGLLHMLQAARHPEWTKPLPVPPPAADGRLRVAFVSGFFRNHSVWKLYGGWVRSLDRQRFRVLGYSTSRKADEETARARTQFDAYVEGLSSFEALAARLRADAPHVIVYPEVGMDAITARLAALRLAPVQYLGMGHPDTTGLPTLDYFLSSELMELPEADAFYNERLVRLPNTSFHYQPLAVEPLAPDLARAGVRRDAVKYLCCQSLYKYRPAYDDIYPRIAREVPDAQFLFIGHGLSADLTRLTRQRLAAAFSAAGLEPERHVVFLSPMDGAHYAGLNAACDIYLDSLDWSGGNTTLEAIAAGLPIVALPGRFLRGRVSFGILAHMGLGDRVPRSVDDFVDQAVRLGGDPQLRAQQAAEIRGAAARLYGDTVTVKALQQHFIAALAAVTTSAL